MGRTAGGEERANAAFGRRRPSNLEVYFEQLGDAITNGQRRSSGVLEALSLNLLEQLHLEKIDVIHTHTWYVSMAGFSGEKAVWRFRLC